MGALPRRVDDGLRPEAERHLVSVETGNGDVDQNQVGLQLACLPDPLETVDGVDHVEPSRRQQLPHEQTIRGIVLDVEDRGHDDP